MPKIRIHENIISLGFLKSSASKYMINKLASTGISKQTLLNIYGHDGEHGIELLLTGQWSNKYPSVIGNPKKIKIITRKVQQLFYRYRHSQNNQR